MHDAPDYSRDRHDRPGKLSLVVLLLV
jgi:hypothetical protein